MSAWVDDLVKNTKNALEDAKKLGQTLAPPTSSPTQPPRVFPQSIGGINTTVLIIGALVALVLWKKIG